MSDPENGAAKWFSNEKGYGFIERDNGGDIFVHYSSIRKDGYKSRLEGQRVNFQIDGGPQGPYPIDVIEIDDG